MMAKTNKKYTTIMVEKTDLYKRFEEKIKELFLKE